MRKLVMLVIFTTSGYFATAQQQTSSASQLIKIHLEPTINITAQSSSVVNLGFRNLDNYTKGVESTSQTFKVHSNKEFVVNVKTNASKFSYSGNETPAPAMPVINTLFMAVENNNTGGSIANTFNDYTSLSEMPKNLLLDCDNGQDRTFAVNYKAMPSTDYPAGDYTVAVIYTATQP